MNAAALPRKKKRRLLAPPVRRRLELEKLEDRWCLSLVLALGLNEGVGAAAADVSPSANHATVSGASWTTEGKFGGALFFDGVNDWLTIADAASLDLTTAMTLEAWVRPATTSGWDTVVLKETTGDLAYALYANDGGQPGVPGTWIRQGNTTYSTVGPASLPVDRWTHLAAAYDGAQLRFYVDGTLAGAMQRTGAINATNGPLRIGGNSVWGEWFHGLIDEVRIYDVALTQAQIQSDMNTPVAAVPDSVEPAVAVTAPADGATVSGSIVLSATASDDVGVAGVRFLVDGVVIGPEDTTEPYSLAWDTQSTANGPHVLTAVARDFAGNETVSAPVAVTIAPDFSFTVRVPTKTVAPTGSTFFEVEVAYLNEFTSANVDLWWQDLPPGISADFAFDPMPHQGRTELFLDSENAPEGSYEFTIGATAEGITHSKTVTLFITSVVDFTVSTSPSVQTVRAGGSIPFAVFLNETNDFTDPVALSVASLPLGMTASFSPAVVVPQAASTLTISTTTAVAPGTYDLEVTAASGGLTHTTPITVMVDASNASWDVEAIASTGVPNNAVRVGALKGDGLQRVYIGTIQTGRMLEYTWNGAAWTGPIDVGGSPTGDEIHNVTIGDGRGDGQNRIYAASYDRKIHEIWFDGTAWRQLVVGTLDGLGMHAVVGVGRNDGVTRLYAASTATLYEFTWTGSAWSAVTVGDAPGAHGLALGDGRGDGANRVYIASISSGTFEATFSGSSWNIDSMGDSGDARDVEMGNGRNDGVMRVYSALLDGRVREFTWNGSSWSIAHTPSTPGAQFIHAYVAPGRNDGVQRLYTSSSNGRAYEFTWNGSAWTRVNMGGGTDYMYGLHFGEGRNDGLIRLYGADRGSVNQVYEYSWTSPDDAPPSVALTAPANGAFVSGTTTISALAADNIGVAAVQFLLDGAPLGPEDTTLPYSIEWDSASVADGPHTLAARARDLAGNVATSAVHSITVDNVDDQPPSAPGELTARAIGGQIRLDWTAATDNVGVTAYRVERQNSASPAYIEIGASAGVSFVDATASSGVVYEYRVRASDAAGNLGEYSNVVAIQIARPGDFDGDGRVTVSDIDSMLAELAAAGNDLRFDLTGDGNVDRNDLDVLVEQLVETSVGVGTRFGDLNLDGVVDRSDAAQLAANFGRAGAPSWAVGDVDGSGAVDLGDLGTLQANLGPTPFSPSAAKAADAVLAGADDGGIRPTRSTRPRRSPVKAAAVDASTPSDFDRIRTSSCRLRRPMLLDRTESCIARSVVR